jgi:hypothetical protein
MVKSVLLAIVGLLVAAFYALESYLNFQANGFTAPLLVKLLICGCGLYLFARSIKQVRSRSSGANEA